VYCVVNKRGIERDRERRITQESYHLGGFSSWCSLGGSEWGFFVKFDGQAD